MDKKKIILIVILVLIVVVYIVFVGWGTMSGGGGGGKGNGKTSAKNYTPSGGMKSFGSVMGAWLGRFLPKPDIPCSGQTLKDDAVKCTSLKPDTDISIPRKKGTTFRIATLVLLKGRAHVVYNDNTGTASDADMDEQEFDLPDSGNRTPTENTIIIFENGGSLRVSCKDSAACAVGYK
jgi:hypothetical protein